MTHQHSASFYSVMQCPPDDVRLRAFGTVVYSLLPTSSMVANADPVSCSQDSTIAEVMA